MTKSKPKSKSAFPDDLYAIVDGGLPFMAAPSPEEMLAPGDKALVGIYRLVETCEMSADVVVTRKSAKK